ncbi:MAG: HAMP domain-containing histidine kinase [Deltaproteobacteria bacterium]|nr:HAMP domain-containing histidine kinase [Deltaproteobacteria bacterium]
MLAKLPLARRIVLAFVLMTALVSGLFSWGIYGTVLFVEEHLVSKELEGELASALEDMAAGRPPRLDARTRLLSSDSTDHPIPDRFRALPEGFTEIANEREAVYVFLRDVGETRHALIQEQSEFEAREHVLFNVALAGFLLCVAGSWALGEFMAARVMEPVTRLARRVQGADRRAPLAPEFADDEIGRLAATFDAAFAQLRQALDRERLFTSDVSHELRTPLMVIASSCELLRESSLTPDQQTQIRRIESATGDMRTLIQAFLLLARSQVRENAAEERITLLQAARDQALHWKTRFRDKGLEFSIIEEETDTGRYNQTFLNTVLSNLLRNAWHYTDRGQVRLVLGRDGFRVEDSGPGIPDEDRERIFDPFVRGSHTRGEGLGLGLSLVQRICAHQGWTITATAMTPRGSCFKIALQQRHP